jgi:hypothetical protein
MRSTALALLLLVGLSTHVDAATVYVKSGGGSNSIPPATSCAAADVQDAHNNHASDGDTLVFAASTCHWALVVTFTKALLYDCNGATIIDDTNNPSGTYMLDFYESTSTLRRVEIKNCTFKRGTTGDLGGGRVRGKYTPGGKAMLFHHNTFNEKAGLSTAMAWETNRGVIWSNTWNCNDPVACAQFAEGFQCQMAAEPLTASWTTPGTMGTADTTGENNVYFETNTMTDSMIEALDMSLGCRIVVRRNLFNNSALTSHGFETGANGLRHAEVYDNTFIFSTNPTWGTPPGVDYCPGMIAGGINVNQWIHLRGGTLVATGNTMTDIPAHCSGAFGAGDSITLTVQNLGRRYANGNGTGPEEINFPCWGAASPPASAPGQLPPFPHQVGQGYDGSHTLDANGNDQQPDPIYVWNNTGTVTITPIDYASQTDECGPTKKHYYDGYITAGVDYKTTARPGWSPYPYPHPLRSAVENSTASAIGGGSGIGSGATVR